MIKKHSLFMCREAFEHYLGEDEVQLYYTEEEARDNSEFGIIYQVELSTSDSDYTETWLDEHDLANSSILSVHTSPLDIDGFALPVDITLVRILK